MSAFASKLLAGSIFNRAAYAGPRRFVIMGLGGAAVLTVIVLVAVSGGRPPLPSQAGRLPTMNPLPGGMQSNPQQDKLAVLTNEEQAKDAASRGLSYTPPIAASQPISTAKPISASIAASSPSKMARATPAVAALPAWPAQEPLHFQQSFPVQNVSQKTVDSQEKQGYANAIANILHGWNSEPPKTDISLPTPSYGDPGGDNGSAIGATTPNTTIVGPTQNIYATRPAQTKGDLLVPAGRGVYAHTILAASSDSEGPVVLQADSGPLAGDRMIGTFGKADSNGGAADRLVVRVNTIEHNGQSITVDGLVTAPDTMETTVASRVDEHYASRFLLPAAAAFIQGLGQALATTSNTNSVLSPFGGTSYTTQLNFPQQVGVGAGVAAQQIGNTLSQAAPRGPTIYLDANSNVGVMFLSDVRTSSSQ